MKIATLGPEGTFSHEAAKQFGGNGNILFQKTIWDVFDSVASGAVEVGIVPVENSVSGSIGMTLDGLMEFKVSILGELLLPVRHHLAGRGSLKSIKTIYVQPQTYEQCEKYIRKHLSKASVVMTLSNAEAAHSLSKRNGKTRAAIVPELSLDLYGLSVISENIQDNPNNTTRFIVIGKGDVERVQDERTSLAVMPKIDKPGLLHHLLGVFAKEKVNLTKIESRPSKGKLGHYVFFIDCEGHQDDSSIKSVLASISREFTVRVFGSYPRGR
tara:strand:- start:163 stop:972 length:810 start_codon:yes stop_codon:yes gene_type:complete